MELYLHATGIISPQGSNNKEDFLQTPVDYHTTRLACQEPDYTAWIPPMQLRRTSKAVRMGIGSAKICLEQAGLERADAISVGTAMGCLQDTEVFLSKMVAQDEQMLTPTAFIQSTHNTVAGQIALLTGCYGHNLTYTQRGHSFEHAVLNTQLYLHQHPDHQMLVGGIDELTDSSFALMQRADVYAQEALTPDAVLNGSGNGTLAGEGSSFFLASTKFKPGSLCIRRLTTFTADNPASALSKVSAFVSEHSTDAFNTVVTGRNGAESTNVFYSGLSDILSTDTPQLAFKHLCGEYPASSAFALGALLNAVKHGLPDAMIINTRPDRFGHILFVNQFLNHYSCWHIEAV